jgi:peroxiredoxin
VCNREAPGVEQFARETAGQLTIVGLGTQDSFEEAQEFLADHDITFPLVWEDGFDTWNAFGVTRQPAAALISGNGDQLGGWAGEIPYDEVREIIAE